MKTVLKYLTIAGLAIVALTWPLFKVSSTEEEEEAAGDKNEFKASAVNPTAEEKEQDAEEGVAGREAYRRLQLQDENGQIPPDAWSHAYQQQAEMPFLPEAWSEFLPSGSEVQNPWVSVGPGNVGGRIRSILIHPGSPEIMWAGGVSGGVWKTLNKGDSWSTTTDLLANLAVNCMVMDPTNPDIIYAGIGEGFTNNDFVQGNGIFKTTDGGNYWTQLPFTKDNANFYFVNRLAISPTNPHLLLAATRNGIFRNTNGGEGNWSQSTGLPNGDWTDIRFQPTSGIAEPDIPDPVISCLAASLYGQVYYSTDNGATWLVNPDNGLYPPDDYQRVELAYSRSTPMIVYASQAGTANRSSELFRSENGGYSFASLGHPHAPTVPGGLPTAYYYANALWVDPINPDTVAVDGQYLLISKDRGAHWQEAGTGSHLDVHMILEHPAYDGTTNKTAYSTNDGGVHVTADILAGSPTPIPGGYVRWTSRNNALGVTQFYGAAGHVATGVIIGGTQDNGTVRFQPSAGPENWERMADGDAGLCAVDQTADPYFYGENIALQIYRSTNGGGKAYYIWGGLGHPHGIPGACGGIPCASFTAPFVLDPNPNQENTILAGGDRLWRTNNAKSEPDPLLVRWDEIKPPTGGAGNYINAIAVAEGDSNVIWVGYNNGTVFYTTNGTAGPSPSPTPSWSSGDPNHVLPTLRACTRITIAPVAQTNDATAARAVYVMFGGFTSGNVWKRENDGVTWTDISTDRLPPTPVYSLVVSRSNPDILYIGTEIGVFASSTGGRSWSPALGTPARTRVVELFWMGPKLVAATHGRGIFTLSPLNN